MRPSCQKYEPIKNTIVKDFLSFPFVERNYLCAYIFVYVVFYVFMFRFRSHHDLIFTLVCFFSWARSGERISSGCRRLSLRSSHSCQWIGKKLSDLPFAFFFWWLFLSRLHACRGAWAHDPKTRSHRLHQLSQPGASAVCFFDLPTSLSVFKMGTKLEEVFSKPPFDHQFIIVHYVCYVLLVIRERSVQTVSWLCILTNVWFLKDGNTSSFRNIGKMYIFLVTVLIHVLALENDLTV